MNETDLAWAAGIIDGEGCIQIAKRRVSNGRREGVVLSVTVNMTHEGTIRRLCDLFGMGSVACLKTSHRKPLWRWALGSAQSEQVVRLVRPYLVTKAVEAEIVIDYRRLVPNRGQQTPENYREHQVQAYMRMQEAKHGKSMEPFFRHRPDKRKPRNQATSLPSNTDLPITR